MNDVDEDHDQPAPSGEPEAGPPAEVAARGPRHLRRARRGRHAAARPRIALYSAAAVLGVSAIGSLFVSTSAAGRPAIVVQADSMAVRDAQRATDVQRASRGEHRTADQPSRPASPPGTGAASSPAQAATPAAPTTAASAAPKPASSPTVHAPVGGLSQAEMNNAVAIIEAGQRLNLPPRAFVVALSTALQESHLHVLANPNVPESMNMPNEGVGYDHDSVGLFQQRPSWGTVAQLMDPHESARLFYTALQQVDGWQQMDVTVAAQTVQVSAYPDAYAKWQSLAEQIVAAVA